MRLAQVDRKARIATLYAERALHRGNRAEAHARSAGELILDRRHEIITADVAQVVRGRRAHGGDRLRSDRGLRLLGALGGLLEAGFTRRRIDAEALSLLFGRQGRYARHSRLQGFPAALSHANLVQTDLFHCHMLSPLAGIDVGSGHQCVHQGVRS